MRQAKTVKQLKKLARQRKTKKDWDSFFSALINYKEYRRKKLKNNENKSS